MRGTTALLLRDLLSKLHPPSPATARESARLLTILDKSFRKQLDDIHPPPSARRGDASQTPVPAEASRPVTSHLNSVLLHPLLETRHTESTHLSPRTSAIYAFDTSLRAGTLTLLKLKKIAKQYLAELKSGSVGNTEQKLGYKIAAWLASESPSGKTAFFHLQPMLQEVVPVMYADGLEGVVWTWLKSVYQRAWVHDVKSLSPKDSSLFLNAEDILISEMMRMSLRQNSLLDAAIQFVEASNYRHQSNSLPASSSSIGEGHLHRPLVSSYRRISTAILQRRNKHDIDASTFDQILKFSVRFTNDTVITRSILHLYHPAAPTAEFLYNDLHEESFTQAWNSWHSKHRTLHRAFLISILDAAQLSLNHRKSAQASFFLDFAGAHWPECLPPGRQAVDESLLDQVRHARKKVIAPQFVFNNIHDLDPI